MGAVEKYTARGLREMRFWLDVCIRWRKICSRDKSGARERITRKRCIVWLGFGSSLALHRVIHVNALQDSFMGLLVRYILQFIEFSVSLCIHLYAKKDRIKCFHWFYVFWLGVCCMSSCACADRNASVYEFYAKPRIRNLWHVVVV